MKRGLCLLLTLALMTGLLSGCGRAIHNEAYVATGNAILMDGEESVVTEEAEDSQNLVLAYYPERSLNPLFGSDYTNRVLMSLMYQPLFAVDSKKNTTPILCSKYKVSTNSRNWTIYLEDNATFSDGSKVTASDVVASYKQAMENDYYKSVPDGYRLSESGASVGCAHCEGLGGCQSDRSACGQRPLRVRGEQRRRGASAQPQLVVRRSEDPRPGQYHQPDRREYHRRGA